MSTATKTVNAAVIGYGGAFNMGREHARLMKEAGIPTVAVCDVDPIRVEAGKAELGIEKGSTDYRELLQEPEINLCVLILPHNLHAPVAIECANAGKHVVVEKPMCVTVAEANAMIAAAQFNNVSLSIYHNRRWDDDFLTIKEIVEEGLIGDIFAIECAIGGYHHPRRWWRSDKEIAGSGLHDWGAHFFDWIFHLIPRDVESVWGQFVPSIWPEATIEAHTSATVRFEGGAQATVEVTSLGSISKPKWRILGTKGGIDANWGDKVTVKFDHNGRMATTEVHVRNHGGNGYYQTLAQHFYEGADLSVKAEQSRRIIAVVEAAEESSRTGKAVVPAHR